MNDYTQMPDSTLVKLALCDEQAFEALVNRHAARIHRLAANMVGPSAADDVVQEVFISVHKGLRGFRGEAQFSTWLHRIALNACYKTLKNKKNLSLSLAEAPEPISPHNPERAGDQANIREHLAQAMANLPKDQREAVALRELSGLEYAEIAKILNIELGTVKSRINRGRCALREFLSHVGLKGSD